MKRSLTLCLSLLCVVAMLLPIAVTALPAGDYSSTAEKLRVDAFTDYVPTSTNGVLNPYPGPYTVGSFSLNDPTQITTFHALSIKFNILCNTGATDDSGDSWSYGGMYLHTNSMYRGRLILPNGSIATAVSYTAQRTGVVSISLDELASSKDSTMPDTIVGAKFAIFKNGVMIWPTASNADDEHGYFVFKADAASGGWEKVHFLDQALAYESFPSDLTVQEGDVISFAMSNAGGHMGFVMPRVTYTSYCGETYTQSESFCGLQGSGGFYAGYSPKGSQAVYAMPSYDESTESFGGKSGAGTVGSGALTVESGSDTVVLFRSPMIATYTLSSPVFSTTGSTAFTATVYRADGSVTKLNEKTYAAGANAFSSISGIYLDRGDVLAMRFSSTASTEVRFDPTLSSTNTVHAESRNGEAMISLIGGFALAPDLHVDAVSASLGGDISLHFYTYFSKSTLASAQEYGLLLFPEGVTDYTYNEAYAHTNGTLDAASGEYRYTYAGIAAKEMTDIVYARPYVKTASGYTYGEVRATSVRSYAESLRTSYASGTTDTIKALCNLACAMLNYGAEAQKYFDYKADDLANASLSAAEKTVTPGEFTANNRIFGTATLQNYAFHAASMILSDLPAIRVYFTAATGKTLDGIRVEAALDEAFTQPVTITAPVWSEANQAYYVALEGISALRMRTPVYFRITNGNEVSKTLVYSAEDYAARCNENNYRSRDAINALFAYTDAALAYATLSGQDKDGIELSAAALADAIRKGMVKENGVYYVTDVAPITFLFIDANKTYDAKNITVHTVSPLVLNNADGLQLSNLNLIGCSTDMTAISIRQCRETILKNVTVSGSAATGISTDLATNNLFLRGIEVAGNIATGISITDRSSNVFLTDSTINATSLAFSDAGAFGSYLKNNTLISGKDGVKMETAGSELRDNTISAPGNAIWISGAKDALAARNTVTGSILCENSDNVVVLKNTAAMLTATGNKHLYTVSNELSGRLTLKSNDYLLADLNTETAVTATGNTNQNGDDVTDVDARLAYGADENLLPHVDKDQFTFYERKETVRTVDSTSQSYQQYVTETLKTEDEVIVAPGAYKQNGRLYFNGQENKTVYAFGVMVEQQEQLKQMLAVDNSENITFIGMTMGFARQSCGQVYVLQKLENNQLLVVTGAGMVNEFGNTNAEYFDTTGIGAQRQGTFYAYCDTGFNSITKNDDGTMTMDVTAAVYSRIENGDILTCRSTNSGTTIAISASSNVTFRDMVIYGNAGGFAFVEGSNKTATTYYRVADTTKSGPVITKEEYDRYRALESTYGVSLEVYTDENGNYRGSLPHIGSIDATHTTKCKEGSQAISCLFENMCDDGTNQNSTHGRLHAVTDNGDGTTTITYKGNYSRYSYQNRNGNTTPNASGLCYPFAVGDRVYIYTSNGQLICDTPALSTTTDGENMTIDWTKEEGMGDCTTGTTPIRYVTVATSAVNFAALEGFDLTANSYVETNKVLIDNMSMASNGFLFDNTMVRNIRSRGLLIKASDATIKNCSLINIGMGAVAVHYEIYWGESGVTENLKVQNNLIQNTGYFTKYNQGSNKIYSPISITTNDLSNGSADEDYLIYKNIEISGNHIVDRSEVDHAIYVNAAKNVKILNNYLGARKGYTMANDTSPSIYIYCASNVEISGNVFPTPQNSPTTRVAYNNADNIYGSDLGGTLHMPDQSSKNRPIINGSSVTYQGNWDYGYMPTGSVSFTAYNSYGTAATYWLTASGKKLWDGNLSSIISSQRGYGGVYITNGYRFAAQSHYNVALRYTVPETGLINISMSSFTLPFSSDSGSANGYFAIFKNGDMIWPKGGNYSTASTWRTITNTTSTADLCNEIARDLTNVSVTKGDNIYFIARSAGSWCAMSFAPSVYRFTPNPTAESSTMALDTDNWPLYTAPTQTGDSFNGSFDGFRGKWTIGYMPVAGGAYTPYGAMFNNPQSILMPVGADSAWTHGGMYLPEGRFALVKNYATTLCYRAAFPGKVDLSVSKLMADTNSSNVVYGAKFAIFVNGQRVWPTTSNAGDANGYYVYTSGTTTYPARSEISFLEAAQAYEAFPTNLTVNTGDLIQFAMVHNGTEMGYCVPCVTYK